MKPSTSPAPSSAAARRPYPLAESGRLRRAQIIDAQQDQPAEDEGCRHEAADREGTCRFGAQSRKTGARQRAGGQNPIADAVADKFCLPGPFDISGIVVVPGGFNCAVHPGGDHDRRALILQHGWDIDFHLAARVVEQGGPAAGGRAHQVERRREIVVHADTVCGRRAGVVQLDLECEGLAHLSLFG